MTEERKNLPVLSGILVFILLIVYFLYSGKKEKEQDEAKRADLTAKAKASDTAAATAEAEVRRKENKKLAPFRAYINRITKKDKEGEGLFLLFNALCTFEKELGPADDHRLTTEFNTSVKHFIYKINVDKKIEFQCANSGYHFNRYDQSHEYVIEIIDETDGVSTVTIDRTLYSRKYIH